MDFTRRIYFSLSLQRLLFRKICSSTKPRHLICFKNWNAELIMDVIESALSLKCLMRDTHRKRMDVLADSKIMILQEINEPFLNMAVSKAATLLGAYDVNITDQLIWENDYMGRVFSYMADAIFVSTMTHVCAERFAQQSSVPVLCMRSRTHASIQALSTVMAVIEEFGTLRGLNLTYFGSPHPVLNSYLLLCPMLGANIKFKCCCDAAKVCKYLKLKLCRMVDTTLYNRERHVPPATALRLTKKCPVSPLLFKASEEMVSKTHTGLKECSCRKQALNNANVIISGPSNPKKIGEFRLSLKDIQSNTNKSWIFFHTGPRGGEVEDNLFNHDNSRTFNAFENFQYIAAAMMTYVIKNYKFSL